MDFLEYIQSTAEIGSNSPITSRFQWGFWVLIAFNLAALAYVRTVSPAYLSILFRTGVYNRQLYQNVQEDLRLGGAGSILLTLSYFNCFALVVTGIINQFSYSAVWLFLGLTAAVFVIKYVLIAAVRVLTETRDGISEHWINHLIYFQIIALVLTPVLALTHFLSPELQFSVFLGAAGFIAFLIVWRDFQSFMRASRLRLPLIYIILYLCTLELIPLVVLIRVLVS